MEMNRKDRKERTLRKIETAALFAGDSAPAGNTHSIFLVTSLILSVFSAIFAVPFLLLG
jgi:hypothetical protein